MRLSLTNDFRQLPFSPSDWVVVAVLAGIALVAGFWILADLSLRFTVEVPGRGGTYSEGIVGTPRFINPILALSDADRDLVALTFSGLLRALPDGSVVPDIAENYTVSDDKRTYTFTIRKDAVFHDKTPITADDVAFTVALAQNPATKSPKRANWEGVDVTVVDARTVSFTLKEPYAPFLENMRLGILPKHLWSTVRVDEIPFSTLNTKPVGEGPYVLSSVSINASGIPTDMTLTAFDRAVRVPYITHIHLMFYPDSDALLKVMTSDATLAAHSVSPAGITNHDVHEAVLGRVFGVFFNQNQNDLFADKAVRKALNVALDKKSIVDTLISGYGSPIEGPLPPQQISPDEAPAKDSSERTADAEAILTADGWTKGSDGVFVKKIKKSVKRLSFVLATGNAPELKGATEAVSSQWKTLGAEVTTQFFEASDLQQEVIRPRKYEALLFGEVVGREMDLFAFWHSSQRNDPGLNIALYTNASVDKLLKDARATDDPVARRNAAQKAANIITDEYAATFLYSPHFIYITPKNLSGLTLGTVATPSDRFINVTDWYLVTERVWPMFAR